MILDIKFPPVAPLPPGERRPMPSDSELDELFAEIGVQASRHPGIAAIRMAIDALSAYSLQNSALIELLIAKGVIGESSREQVREIVGDLNAKSNKRMARSFIGYAAQGLMRINDRPLAPDDAATLVSMFVDEDPDFGSALSSFTKKVFTPEHMAVFFGRAFGSSDPLGVLLNYRVHEDAESKTKDLSEQVRVLAEEAKAAKVARVDAAVRLEEIEKDAKARIAALEKEVGRLRDELTTFRGHR